MNALPGRKTLDEMKPREIVGELDKYIIGQDDAKRTIAVAIRNRTRRKRLPADIRDEVSPKNIILIGPTGVGKTEIARRIAKLSNAPFIKVEATKYTEVGYVGRDVESIIRDLMGIAVNEVKQEMACNVSDAVKDRVENRLLDLLVNPVPQSPRPDASFGQYVDTTREQFRQMLREGKLEDKEVEVAVANKPQIGIEMFGSGNSEDIRSAMDSIGSLFGGGGGVKKRKVPIHRAREILQEEEVEKSVDPDKAVDVARERVEQMGIVFIDEIDKIANSGPSSGNLDVSREGVQRDILPIVEGTKVSTKWGVVDTTHILFIASGAFHVSKPSDLIPELQGRFPLRVELNELREKDFFRILTEPKNAITKQYQQLLKTEGVDLQFTDEALHRISQIAFQMNSTNDNIGARRLFTIMEKMLEELSFNADELDGQTVMITAQYVDEHLKGILEDQDLSKFIL
ncbi:MAG: ATP-dependent protease ATPase subunit HslU [Sphaerochaetaceae bacterium]